MREGTVITIIYALMWLILFLKLWKNFRKYTTSIFVVFFYLLYSILAIVLYNSTDFSKNYNDVTLFPYIYLFLAILLSLRPIFSFDRSCVTGLVRPSTSLVNTFTFIFVLLAIVSMPNAITEMHNGIARLIMDSSGGADLYLEAHGGNIYAKTLADVPKYLFSIFSYVSIFVFFYYLTLPRLKSLALFGLTIAMIYNLLRPISMGLRTDTVMTVFAFVAGFVLMRRWIPKNRRKLLIKISTCIGGLVFALMTVLAISRFTESTGGVAGANLDYVAQSSLNFNNYGLDAGGIRYGDRTCRIFKELMGFDVPDGIMERRYMYHNMKMNDSIFYTFVGDFTLDFGPVVAFVLFIMYSCFFTKITKVRRGVISFSKLIIVYLTVLIPLQGGMYLFTFSDGGNYSLMAFAFTSIIFSIPEFNNPQNIKWAYN